MLSIVVPGKPIAQARPKFRSMRTKGGKSFGMAYSTQDTEAGRFALLAKSQLPTGFELFTVPLVLTCLFAMPIPASIKSKKIRASMLAREIMPAKKPDCSNMIKWVEDCLNLVVWHDDSLIVEEYGLKFYAEQPCTRLIVYPYRAPSAQAA